MLDIICAHCGREVDPHNSFVSYTPWGSVRDMEPPEAVCYHEECWGEVPDILKRIAAEMWYPPRVCKL